MKKNIYVILLVVFRCLPIPFRCPKRKVLTKDELLKEMRPEKQMIRETAKTS
jgi:hypothetical protein